MLDARDACSGASGRNGGHDNPQLYRDYGRLKNAYGEEVAKKVIRFRLAHFSEMKCVSEEEDILKETQCREVKHCEVYFDQKLFDSAKKNFEIFRADLAKEATDIQGYDSKDGIEKFHLASDVVGCFVNHGGAINPYRLVTGVLSRLLSRHPENFWLLTNTPCTNIAQPTSTTPFYALTTPRGTITAPHVIHATNAHLSHLIPSFRSKMAPVRRTITAQRPGQALRRSTFNGLRSFLFYRQKIGYDYLTQLPNGENELIFGGAIGAAGNDLVFKEIANMDDSGYNPNIAACPSGMVPFYFGHQNWGAERTPESQKPGVNEGVKFSEGRVKAIWSGILCISADILPWVGRLPVKLAARQSPPTSSTPTIEISKTAEGPVDTDFPTISTLTVPPGEWISASYSGEGMVHAWLCAKALAFMVLGAEEKDRLDEWFPDVMKVTEARWEKADIERLLEELGSNN